MDLYPFLSSWLYGEGEEGGTYAAVFGAGAAVAVAVEACHWCLGEEG